MSQQTPEHSEHADIATCITSKNKNRCCCTLLCVCTPYISSSSINHPLNSAFAGEFVRNVILYARRLDILVHLCTASPQVTLAACVFWELNGFIQIGCITAMAGSQAALQSQSLQLERRPRDTWTEGESLHTFKRRQWAGENCYQAHRGPTGQISSPDGVASESALLPNIQTHNWFSKSRCLGVKSLMTCTLAWFYKICLMR